MIDSASGIVLDTGVMVEILEDKQKTLFNHIISGLMRAYITSLSLTELQYVMCRKLGSSEAGNVMEEFISSNLVMPLEIEGTGRIAADLKCKFPIAIADCYSLALGKQLGLPVYMRKEKEIVRVLSELKKEVEIIFV